MDWKKLNVKIEIPVKVKRLLILVIGCPLLANVLVGQLDYLPLEAYRVGKFLLPIISAIPAFIIFKKEGKSFKELIGDNILKQIVLGLLIGVLLICIVGIKDGGYQWTMDTALFVGSVWHRIYYTAYYLIVVGFMEEFIYRIVIQGYLTEVLGRFKVLAPILASLAFSFAHYSAGSIELLAFVFVWGLIWGYLRHFNKNITYLVLGVSHGFYDFGIMVMPYIISLFV